MKFLPFLAALALLACPRNPDTLPPGPDPIPVPPATCESASACECAGDRLKQLECKSKKGAPLWETPEGVPFAEACRVALEDGRHWHPECIQNISRCDETECAFRGDCRCP